MHINIHFDTPSVFTVKKVIVVIPYTHSEKFLHVFFEISEPSH
jgi:hypothetical protein